jgi:hypothetical protein
MNPYSTYNADRLERLRRTRNRTQRWSWLFGAASVVLLLLLVVSWTDYGLGLPSAVRWVCAGLLLTCAALGVVHWIRLWRYPSDLKSAVLELESRRPDLGCLVSTATEYLEGGRAATRDYEPELVAALQESAARKLVRIETPWYRRKLVGTAAALGFVGAIAAVFLMLVPAGGVAMARVLAPWSTATYTRVEVAPGNLEIPEGSEVEISGRFSGRPPTRPRIEWRPASSAEWLSANLQAGSGGHYGYTFRNLHGALHYRLAGGDAVSPAFEIATYVPPKIDALRIGIEYPAYTGREPSEVNDPNLAVVRASRLTFRISASGEVAQARLRFADQPGLELQVTGDNIWTATIEAERDLYYWVDLIDAQGRKGSNEQPYKLTVRPDEPPSVAIFDPNLDIRAASADRVPIQISVSDDFGIEQLDLVFQKVGGQSQTVRCAVEGIDPREGTASLEIDLEPLGLKDYELVSYYAQARDNNTMDGPGRGRSPVYFIEVTSKERALSQCNGRSQRVNLLEIQKQIVAATLALEPDAPHGKFLDLSAIQRQALEYAGIFKEGFLLALAPPEARVEFSSAMEAMETASKELEERRRSPALEAEQSALAHLYQACRLLPELEAGMCRGEGNCIQIVLEAIEKLKEERRNEAERNLPAILEEARRMARAQAALNDIYRRGGEPNAAMGSSAAAIGQAQVASQGQAGQIGAGQSSRHAEAANDPEFAGSHLTPPGADGDGESQIDGAEGISEEQRRLGESAAALAARLRELSGRNPGVGHQPAVRMGEVSKRFHQAGMDVMGGDLAAASGHGGAGLSALADVIARLERLLDRPAPSDPATEEYPREYEALVAEYFRKLSFDE